jgi:hypothetical protein
MPYRLKPTKLNLPMTNPALSGIKGLSTLKFGIPVLFVLLSSISPLAHASTPSEKPAELVNQYCTECHGADKKSGDLNLEAILNDDLPQHAEIWEKALLRLRTRQMPPPGKKRPDEKGYGELIEALSTPLDRAYSAHPNPGRPDTFRRLNRTEYQNAIRDLIALEIDAAALLPKDEASHGFDNITVGTLSPTLLDRYITAAEKISRLAIGATARSRNGETYRVKADVTQEEHIEGLPLGTRGGILVTHTFPLDAQYEFQVRLARDRNEEVEGLSESHDVELLIDGEPIQSFIVSPPKGIRNWELVDQNLKARAPIKAGPHQVGVTFVRKGASLSETKRQPYSSHYNMHRHPRLGPAVYQVSINGPFETSGAGDSPSRQRIFVRHPKDGQDEEVCVREILSKLMRRAYRRPASKDEVGKAMGFYREGRTDGDFEAGIERALSSILVSPNFLFRVERDPAELSPKSAYPISDIELASRLSFFLWSSIPDDELLDLAEHHELSKPGVLDQQARRMLADARASSLASNFAGQWLYLRNLESITPDLRLFPDFDDNLRQALRQETEMFFESILQENGSAIGLLKANYTFLNERLARHYRIPYVYGNRFRRVTLSPDSHRGGLLRHGSVLMVTSYANRTSPVLRGNWILGNVLGTPTPPPPANVPALKDNTVLAKLSVRARLAEHRADAACAGCHNRMDPVGFALENFDAVGRWRELEEDKPVDATGGLPDGSTFTGIDGLETALLAHPDNFAYTLTEKLMTFALGRGVEYFDAPAVRKIVHDAQGSDYRFSDLIVGIVKSTPFIMRNTL